MTLLEREPNETARQYALRMLRNNIVNLELKPGQAISENEIGELLGLSRTPVREALRDLAAASVLEIQPQRGTFVSLIDMEIMEEARFLRNVVEKSIVELLCARISQDDLHYLEENLTLQELIVGRGDYARFIPLDNDFHQLLFKACGKTMTYDCIRGLMVHFDRIRFLNAKEMDMCKPFADHKNILAAIKEKDKARAVEEMDRHLTRVTGYKFYLYDLHPEYFKNMNRAMLH